MKKLSTLEELGKLTTLLSSNKSSYTIWQSIVIDGSSTLTVSV